MQICRRSPEYRSVGVEYHTCPIDEVTLVRYWREAWNRVCFKYHKLQIRNYDTVFRGIDLQCRVCYQGDLENRLSARHESNAVKSVIVIGAGLGGLATALRLHHRGFDVTVVEKLSRIGGRCGVIARDGFRIDTGPTILVMKEAFEGTYRAIGKSIDKRVELIRIDPNYRVYYHDDTSFDLHASMPDMAEEVERIERGAGERYFQFLGESSRKYELGMEVVTRN